MKNNQVKRVMASYLGENHDIEKKFLNGEIEIELIPQGTLVEKCRAGGAGIPAFCTRRGVGTLVEEMVYQSSLGNSAGRASSQKRRPAEISTESIT